MWTQTWTTTVRDCTLLYIIVNLSNYMIMVNQIINRILVQFCFFDWSSELRNSQNITSTSELVSIIIVLLSK